MQLFSPPYFSIVIPAFNRERCIIRALESCLTQDFTSWEAIVVDDGSTDRTASLVSSVQDLRIKLVRHGRNRERLVSRNTGAANATGEWIVWLDSDDELALGALSTMFRRINECAADVDGLRFRCNIAGRRISPDNPYSDGIWDYAAYLRWVEVHLGKWAEMLPVVRASTFASVTFPVDEIFTGETQYHLDFLKRFKVRTCEDVLLIVHYDEQSVTRHLRTGPLLKGAEVRARRFRAIIAAHGDAMLSHAPRLYRQTVAGCLTQILLAGNRMQAFKFWITYCSHDISLRPISILILGILGKWPLAAIKVHLNRLR